MSKTSFSPAMLLGLGALIVPATAQAQDSTAPADRGFYGSLSVGGEETHNTDSAVFGPEGSIFNGEGGILPCEAALEICVIDIGEGVVPQAITADDTPAGADSVRGRLGTKTGIAFAGSVGYDFGLIRAEVEASYWRAKVSGFTVTGGTEGGDDIDADEVFGACEGSESEVCDAVFAGDTFGAKLRQLSGMANVWLDIPLGISGIEPYVGGGVGFTRITLTGIGHDTKFSWQLGGGLAIPLGDRLKLTVDYRHRETRHPDFGESDGFGFLVDKLKSDAVLFGVRAYF